MKEFEECGDISGDVSTVILAVCSFPFTILICVGVHCIMVGEATGPRSGALYLLETETSLELGFCQWMVEGHILQDIA